MSRMVEETGHELIDLLGAARNQLVQCRIDKQNANWKMVRIEELVRARVLTEQGNDRTAFGKTVGAQDEALDLAIHADPDWEACRKELYAAQAALWQAEATLDTLYDAAGYALGRDERHYS